MANTKADPVESLDDIRKASKVDRPLHAFDVPETLAMEAEVYSVALVELTPKEEIQASARARNDFGRLANEMVKASLREVNGEPVSLSDGSADKAWNRMHPKVRNLVNMAFGRIHNPEDSDTEAFLASRQTRVG